MWVLKWFDLRRTIFIHVWFIPQYALLPFLEVNTAFTLICFDTLWRILWALAPCSLYCLLLLFFFLSSCRWLVCGRSKIKQKGKQSRANLNNPGKKNGRKQNKTFQHEKEPNSTQEAESPVIDTEEDSSSSEEEPAQNEDREERCSRLLNRIPRFLKYRQRQTLRTLRTLATSATPVQTKQSHLRKTHLYDDGKILVLKMEWSFLLVLKIVLCVVILRIWVTSYCFFFSKNKSLWAQKTTTLLLLWFLANPNVYAFRETRENTQNGWSIIDILNAL